MTQVDDRFNPFPGLRPFKPDEDYLFFGREGQSDELLRQLQRTRFVAIVGTSGSGKSSLVRAGLLPALYGGFMTKAGSGWRVANMRPGNDPIGELARALDQPTVFGADGGANASELIQATTMTETILRRSALGVVHVVEEAGLPANENLLLLVDQFEELFRFRDSVELPERSDDAAAFVKLLLEASRAKEFEIYVVLTMRSDFLGDCAQFRDLPEAINKGQYLIPRMSRDQYRRTIEGPVAVGGATITQQLVQRLLSDLGDSPDQLPILQHALMRTWDIWQDQHEYNEPLDLPHYEEIGGMSQGLSKHADEVYDSLSDTRSKEIAKKVFKRLTGKGPDNRGIRWPTRFAELCAVADASEDEVIKVVEAFRQPGRSFLVPPVGTPIEERTVIDIAHESLMRIWARLRVWVEEESESAEMYRRLAERAVLHKEGRAGLWRDPELQLGLEWREDQQPNEAWGRRYHPELDTALDFLEESRSARDAELAAEEETRKREIRRLRIGLAIAVAVIVFVVGVAAFAIDQYRQAVAAREVSVMAQKEAVTAQKEAETAQKKAETAEQQARARLHLAQANDIYASNPLLGIRLALEALALLPDEDILNATQDLIDQGRIAHISSDTVSLAPYPDDSALFVLGVEEGLSEIRHANRIARLARLAEPLEDVVFNSDGTLFLVDYDNAPSELRRTADGAVVATLSSDIHYQNLRIFGGGIVEVGGVFFSPSATSGILVVNYEEQPAEVWDSASGELLATLLDDVFEVTFSPEETLFVVDYLDPNIPDEVRKAADGSVLVTGISNVTYSPDGTLFVVDYLDHEVPDELRQIADGNVLATDILAVTFSPEGKFFIVNYRDPNTPDELRRTSDGSVIEPLADDVRSVSFSPGETLVVIDYSDDDVLDELRQTDDGSLVKKLVDDVHEVIFSPGETLVFVDYSDGDVPDELRRTADGSLIVTLVDDVRDVTFNREATLFFVEYSNNLGELRLTADGSVLATDVSNTNFSPGATLVFVEHIDVPGELRRTVDGGLVATGIANVAYSPDGKLLVVNYRDPDIPDELRRTVDGSILETGFSSASFSPEGTFFLLQYEDPERMAELRRTADGGLLKVFSNPDISRVIFSSDEETFVVYYMDGSAEVFRTTEGESLATFTGQVSSVEFDSQVEEFLVRKVTGLQEHDVPLYGLAGEEVTIKIENDNLPSDRTATLSLNDSDGDEIMDDSGAGEAQIHNFRLPESGRYAIKIYGDSPGTYTLSINVVASGVSNETESTEPRPSTAFVVYYANGRAEVWRIPVGEQLTTIDDVARVTFGPDPENSVFVVEHVSGSYEVRHPESGKVVKLSGPVSNIDFSPDDESAAFIVRYTEGTAELRRTADGELITRLTSNTSEKEAVVLSSSGSAAFFGLRYSDSPTEIYSSTDGKKLADLPGDAYDLLCAHQETVETIEGNIAGPSGETWPLDGVAGDIVNISMDIISLRLSNDSFAYLELLDSRGNILEQDRGNRNDNNLLIRDYRLPYSGSYAVTARSDCCGGEYTLSINTTYPAPDDNHVCVVAYTESELPGEVRRAADGELLATLEHKVFDVTFGHDPGGGVFIVNYADAPSEVRSTIDGRLVARLPGAATKVTFSPNPDKSVFIVDFAEAPSEVRRTADGQLLATLTDKVLETIFSPDVGATAFIVTYASESAEVRRTADGELLESLSGEVLRTTFSPDPEATFFSVSYADKPSEVRRTADGELLAVLNGGSVGLSPSSPSAGTSAEQDVLTDLEPVPDADVEFSSSAEAPLFVVKYAEGQTEVRRTVDGSVVTSFAEVEDKDSVVRDVIFSQEATAAVFIVEYSSGLHEVRRILNGEVVPLTDDVFDMEFSAGENPAAFVVHYVEAPPEIRRLGDASILATLNITNRVQDVAFSPYEDTPVFIVDYVDEAGEVYSLEDGRRLRTLTTAIDQVTFDEELAAAFVVDYEDPDALAELRSTTDGQVLVEFSKPDFSRIAFSSDGELFVVYYPTDASDDDESADIYRTREKELLASFTDPVSEIVFDYQESDDFTEFGSTESRTVTAFIVHYKDGRAEMWSIPSGKKLATLPDVESVTFSGDPDSAVVIVKHSSSGLLEVRRKTDGIRLAEMVTDIKFSPDREANYFFVTYDGAPAEIIYIASGQKVALENEVVDLAFSTVTDGTFYFVVEYVGDRSHVWIMRDGSPQYITDLGLNVANHFVDVLNQRLVVRYEDGRVNLVDLEMPEAFRDMSPAKDMLEEVCKYLFSPGTFDEAELKESLGVNEAKLKKYLGENEPAACR